MPGWCKSLSNAGARVIAFDATFSTPESNSGLEALRRLQAEIGSGAPPSFLKEIRALEVASDQDAAFAAALKDIYFWTSSVPGHPIPRWRRNILVWRGPRHFPR